jgi:FkbM family methyltransferase
MGLLSPVRRAVFGVQMRRKARHDEPELALVPALCPPGRLFLDVGANRGLYAWRAQRAGARVIAIEPHPGMAAQLRRSFGAGLEVRELALSDAAGSVTLHVPLHRGRPLTTRSSLHAGANPGLELTAVEVECARLDDLALPPLGMIKIDVEGHELAAVRGAQARLAADRPTVMVEVEERHNAGAVAAMHALMTAARYAGFFLVAGRLRPFREFDAALHQRGEHAVAPGGQRVPGAIYINNFVFLHDEDAAVRARLRSGGWL